MIKKNAVCFKLFLFLFFFLTVAAPLIFLLVNAGRADFAAIVSTVQFRTALKNSLFLAFCAACISLVLALALAFAVERSAIRHKNTVTFLLTLPMLIPSISHGMGLIILFGQNGFITNLFSLKTSIYGFGGVLAGSVLYSFPPAFLMMRDILKYEDCSSYRAADILGVPKLHQFFSITLPYVAAPLLRVFLAVFTLVITDYGVPLMVRGKFATLPVFMYEEVIGLLNFEKGSVIGLALLIPSVIAFAADMFKKEQGVHSFVVEQNTPSTNRAANALAAIFCALVCAVVVLPLLAFGALSVIKKYPVDITLSLYNISRSFSLNAGTYLLNSVFIGLAVSLLGTLFAYVTAYVTARVKGGGAKALHLLSVTSMAIPGIVLGLSYALLFKGSFIYGTFIILILVNLTHFFSSPYLIAYNSFNKLNGNLEAVGETLGIGKWHLLKDVFMPQMTGTLLEMFAYFFVNCMMTISAVSFLFTSKTMPVSMLITQFEAQMLLECSAFISILILAVNMAVKLGLNGWRKHVEKGNA